MVAKTRVIYTQGKVEIEGVGAAVIQTAQNATFTITVPRENVNAMGFSGTVDRPQLDANDATLEFAFIPQTSGSAGLATDMTGGRMNALIEDSIKGTPVRSKVHAAGIGSLDVDGAGAASALMNSISVDGAVGAMPTTTLGFTGVAAAVIPPAEGFGVGGIPGDASTLTVTLVEPQNIALSSGAHPAAPGGSLLPSSSCAQSGAIAWDLPVEVILCLDDNPETDGVAFGNPPGTASITVEALADEIEASEIARNYLLTIGDFAYTLNKARIDSKTNSMAVGDLFATFNYVLGGTADGMDVA
jgi:hypothetical protein